MKPSEWMERGSILPEQDDNTLGLIRFKWKRAYFALPCRIPDPGEPSHSPSHSPSLETLSQGRNRFVVFVDKKYETYFKVSDVLSLTQNHTHRLDVKGTAEENLRVVALSRSDRTPWLEIVVEKHDPHLFANRGAAGKRASHAKTTSRSLSERWGLKPPKTPFPYG